MRFLPLLLTSLIGPLGVADGVAAAAKSSAVKVNSEIEQSLKPLRQKDGAALRLKKRTTNSLLGREKNSEGRLYYRKGKLRLELKSPEDSLVVLDGKTLWLVTVLSADMGGKTMVTKTSARSLKKSSTLMAALIENQQILKEFNLSERKATGDDIHLKFTPKNKDGEIQDLQLWLNPKAGRLKKVLYIDDKENEVEFELGVPEVVEGDPAKLFSYTPPKGAEITEF